MPSRSTSSTCCGRIREPDACFTGWRCSMSRSGLQPRARHTAREESTWRSSWTGSTNATWPTSASVSTSFVRAESTRLPRCTSRQGVARFVTEQYAESLSVGCMLGYVMDGDVEAATTKIYAAIDNQRARIGLAARPETDRSIGEAKRFFSRHLRAASGQEIEVRHALLPFDRGTSTGRRRPQRILNL